MDSRPPLAHDIFFTSGEVSAVAMMWVLWASVAFATGMLVFVVGTRLRRRRRFEANRAEIEQISAEHGISLDDAYDLLGMPPELQASHAHILRSERR